MDLRLTLTDCDEAGVYVVPNVLSPRDLVSRPDNINETVLHTILRIHSLSSKDQKKNIICTKDECGETF